MFYRFLLGLIVVLAAFPSYGQDKNIALLKEAEELAVISQTIVKDYFYIAQGHNVSQATKELNKNLKAIRHSITVFGSKTKEAELSSLIRYMDMTVSELEGLLTTPYNEDNAMLIMDMSEVLLESSESLSEIFGKNVKRDHSHLDLVEHQYYLLERMAKFYIAIRQGINDHNTVQQMKQSIEDYDKGLSAIEKVKYPKDLHEKVIKLRQHWNSSRVFYEKAESGKLPRTVFMATELMAHMLKPLIEYHSS